MSETHIDDITLDETEVGILRKINQSINIMAILLSFVACVVFLYARKVDAAFTKRKMTVLSFLVCLSDCIYHILSISLGISPEKPSSDSVCEFLMWGYTFSCLTSMGFVVGVNLHLQMVFLSSNAASDGLNIRKHTAAVLALSSILAFIPLAFKGYSWSNAEQLCWFNFELNPTTALVLQWTCLYGWISLTLLSSFFTVFAVLKKLVAANREKFFQLSTFKSSSIKDNSRTATDGLSQPQPSVSNNSSRSSKAGGKKIDTAKVASRLILYPIILLLCQGTMIIVETTATITGEYRFLPYVIEYIFLSGQGFFDGLVFLTDRNIMQWFKELLLQRWPSKKSSVNISPS
ncbi:hypothetical protein BKA69DRAFT_1127777 [Paraphysoderma sedebokerense]|nr:hypothetical protein BKA69DRAFT_1127777 [Paraphysoderma sedebokerense]